MQVDLPTEFDDLLSWARFYRSLGWQVVPARTRVIGDKGTGKIPALTTWRELQDELLTDEAFDALMVHEGRFGHWYEGRFYPAENIGVITGRCSGDLAVIDVDTAKEEGGVGERAMAWLRRIEAEHNGGDRLETATQITGSGGLQIMVRWPSSDLPKNAKTTYGVDIRGQGGFAVLPPSMHYSAVGAHYAWLPGFEPGGDAGAGVRDAWAWMLPEVAKVIADGKAIPTPGEGATPARERFEVIDGGKTMSLAGEATDGREDVLYRSACGVMTDAYRKCPIKPDWSEILPEVRRGAMTYVEQVKPRLRDPTGATPKAILLDMENPQRGPLAFEQRCRYLFDQWEGKLRELASNPPEHKREKVTPAEAIRQEVAHDPETGEVFEDDDGFGPAPPPKPDHMELFSIDKLMSQPYPKWLVKNLIPQEGVGFLYGPPGCGKSFWALHLALCLAAGLPQVLGFEIREQAGVLYLAGEGRAGAKQRLMAWVAEHGVELNGAHPFDMAFEPCNFMQADDVQRLVRTIEAHKAARGAAPRLIIVDTVSRVLPGADENKQQDMTLFIEACQEIQQLYGCVVMGVHHVAKGSGQMRGSGVLLGAADFAFGMSAPEVEADGEDAPPPIEGQKDVEFKAEKIKDAPDKWVKKLHLIQHAWRDEIDEERSSLAVSAAGASAPSVSVRDAAPSRGERRHKAGWPQDRELNVILDAMRAAAARGDPWDRGTKAKSQNRGVFENIKALCAPGCDDRGLSEMLTRWEQSGVIKHRRRPTVGGRGDYPRHWGGADGFDVVGYLDQAHEIERTRATGTDDENGFG